MSKYGDIVRLWEEGVPQRDIAASTRCSLRTVSRTVKAARVTGVGSEVLAGRDDATVKQLLFGVAERVSGYREPDFAEVERLLRQDSVTLTLVWDEYVRACEASGEKPYQYSWWCESYAKWRQTRGASPGRARMRLARVPGQVVEVDWAGSTMDYTDRATGEVRRAWVFVGCLPFSQRLYAEAFDDMKQPSWIRAHVDMFRFFGGVPRVVVPDNCKTGVVKPDYYDPVVNPDYAQLAAHYGFAVVPARPASPRDKGAAENTVKFVQTWIVAYLRERVFFSLAEVNQAVRDRVVVLNAQQFHGLTYSRDDVFAAEEADTLQPLPATEYELATWRTAKVGFDYCVQVERQRYSVPYQLIGRQVDVRLTDHTVEIFDQGQRVASHPRLKGRLNQASVLAEHMPDAHKMMMEAWNPDRFTRWAASIGPNTVQVIESILTSKPHPAQTYRACMGVLSYAKTRGASFLEDVCAQAVEVSAHPSYTQIKNLAAHPRVVPPHPDQPQELPGVGTAGLVRGADYYRMGDQR